LRPAGQKVQSPILPKERMKEREGRGRGSKGRKERNKGNQNWKGGG
jgi:hypothetical protein